MAKMSVLRRQIQRFLFWGLSQVEIAERLGTSQQVVSYHRKKIREAYFEEYERWNE